MFYLTMHSTHFIYGYMVSDIWLRTILIVGKETRYRHIGYSYRLTARVLLYAPSHRQDNTYHSLCYTSCGALAGTRNSSMGPPVVLWCCKTEPLWWIQSPTGIFPFQPVPHDWCIKDHGSLMESIINRRARLLYHWAILPLLKKNTNWNQECN